MPLKAIVDAEDLERFARELKEFNNMLQERTKRLNGQFIRLSETWRDQEHRKFVQEFEKTTRVIQQFIKIADEHIPFLLRKAQRVREYLQQR